MKGSSMVREGENILFEMQHVKKAKSNNDFLKLIENSEFYDWIITTSFYTSLHYVSAYLRKYYRDEEFTHSIRKDLIITHINNRKRGWEKLKKIKGLYFNLHDRCDHVRYNLPTNAKDKFSSTQINDFKKNGTEILPKELGYLE